VFVERGLHVTFLGRIVFCLLLAVAGAAFWYIVKWENRTLLREVIASWIQVVGMLGACLLLLTVAGRAATSVSNERDKETLDGLLTSPVSTNAILFAKWVGAMLSIRWGMFCLLMIYLLGVWEGAVQWITIPLMLLAWITYTAVVAVLGLWYSVICRSSTSATVWTYLSTAGLAVGHWLDMICMIPLFFSGQFEAMSYLVRMQAGFTPPFALSISFFVDSSSRSPDAVDQIFYGLAGLGAWLVVAGVLWIYTSSRFELMCGRSTLLESPADPDLASLEPATDGGFAPATNG
jgi:ABC-type Na+ efflux pump permease subunit